MYYRWAVVWNYNYYTGRYTYAWRVQWFYC